VIIDYRGSSATADIDVDLCVIGAGAAGIAIARHFIGTSVTVCLVEGGGATGEEQSQALYNGTSIGALPLDAGTSRMRVFGGSCNLWGGGCIPLGKHDLAERQWVPHSGWPVAYDELKPYYERAREFCQIEAHEFTDGSFQTSVAHTPIPFDADSVRQCLSTRPGKRAEYHRFITRQLA
jgi:choline dehydrogenase-like flavoprotein